MGPVSACPLSCEPPGQADKLPCIYVFYVSLLQCIELYRCSLLQNLNEQERSGKEKDHVPFLFSLWHHPSPSLPMNRTSQNPWRFCLFVDLCEAKGAYLAMTLEKKTSLDPTETNIYLKSFIAVWGPKNIRI